MAIWLLLLVLLLAAVVLLAQQRIRQLRRGARADLPDARTLFTLRQGDIVQFEGQDWVVEDRLLYDDEGFQWLEYLLLDGRQRRWLSVVEDDWLELAWLEPAPEALLNAVPLQDRRFPAEIRWEGVTYALRESGRASMTASARTMNLRPGGCRYGDYTAEGDRVLAVELWDGSGSSAHGDVDISLGRRIDPGLVSFLPGDGRSVYR